MQSITDYSLHQSKVVMYHDPSTYNVKWVLLFDVVTSPGIEIESFTQIKHAWIWKSILQTKSMYHT